MEVTVLTVVLEISISKLDITGGIKRRPNILHTEHTGKRTAWLCSSEAQLTSPNAAMELFFIC